VDTNTVERSMRPIGLGRKNSLFSGSEGGAESWAILDDRFHESCHKRGIHLGFRTPI
jgi:hypothetical protein